MSETLTPNIQSVECTPANTQVTVTLPANCKGFSIQARTAADVRFSFTTGKVAGPVESGYITLKSGQSWNSPDKLAIISSNSIIYFACGTDHTFVEVLSWS